MTIQSIGARQSTPPAARLRSVRTAKLPRFTADEHLTPAVSSQVTPATSRPFVGVSGPARHFFAVPDRRPAATAHITDLSNSALLQNAQPRPFYVTNSNYNPTDVNSPETVQDPTATAAPQLVQWTSPNGLTTTGVMNPFGLTQNNPGMGFYGTPSTTTR